MVADPGRVDEVRSILLGPAGPNRAELGCIAYELLRNRSDPTDFSFVEGWEGRRGA